MPLMGFTVFKDKLLSGEKCQTIRRPRKRPLKVGDKLYCYWKPRTKQCEKLGESIITKIERMCAGDFTDKDAKLDGFINLIEMVDWFVGKYGVGVARLEFNIISFDPICDCVKEKVTK